MVHRPVIEPEESRCPERSGTRIGPKLPAPTIKRGAEDSGVSLCAPPSRQTFGQNAGWYALVV